MIGVLLLCTACLGQNQVLNEVKSPDGDFRAVASVRSVGATTGANVQLSLVRDSWPLYGAGNLFIANASHGIIPPEVDLASVVELRWRSATELHVVFDRRVVVLKDEPERHGITVTYEAADLVARSRPDSL